MRKQSNRFLRICILAAVLLLGGGYFAVRLVDERADRFFNTGKTIVETLRHLSKAVQAKDLAAIEPFYASDYHGSSLGTTRLVPAGETGDIRELRFGAERSPQDRNAAVAEWRAYLEGFESIEEVGMHLYHLEKWGASGDWVATVRLEVIGKPKDAARSSIDRALFQMTFQPGKEDVRIREASLLEGSRLTSNFPHFENVGEAAGIAFKNRYYPAFLNQPLRFGMIRYGPGGISAVDYDNDGFYDLFIPDGVESRLFHNRGDGTFEDVTAKAGLSGLDGVGVGVFADYDNDGFKDLFVARTFQPNQLFHNNGNGTFTDVTKKSGIGADCCTTVASWADYDNDGYLDLYVGRYLDPRKDIPTTFYARNGEPNQLYHNNGNGTFTNVTEKSGVGDRGLCLGSAWGDYDNDGFPDLLVVNDFGRATLFHNDRNGTFTDVTVKANTLAYGAGMSASFADYDNDGKLDMYTADILSEHAWFAEEPTVSVYMLNSMRQSVWRTDMPLYWQIFRQSGFGFIGVFQEMAAGNHLLHNNGDGTFENVAAKSHANPPGWFWGASFADFDNDGWQDIYVADGWVYNDPGTEIELDFLHNVVNKQKDYKTGLFFDPKHFGTTSWHGWERNRMLHNRGDGTFVEAGRPTNTDLLTNSRGVAVADFWNRGVLDIAVSASDDRHALLKNEVGTKRNWLAVELVGTKSNRDAVGARVTLRVNGKQQMREVVLGDGYGSQNSLRLYFGLDKATAAEEVTVQWPRSGLNQKFQNVAGNRIVEVTEGKQEVVEKHYGVGAR